MSEAKGDPRVTEVQEWLNETYGAQSWFTKLTVDGMSRNMQSFVQSLAV